MLRAISLVLLPLAWCLPQILLSAFFLPLGLITGGRLCTHRGAFLLRWPPMERLGGVCLGPLIVVGPRADAELVCHEWGHFRQHLRLGWLYYLVIGLPSLLHAAWFRARGMRGDRYFWFYTEAWADALGGVYGLHRHRHPRWWQYLTTRPRI
jgi:hypothetical protein